MKYLNELDCMQHLHLLLSGGKYISTDMAAIGNFGKHRKDEFAIFWVDVFLENI